MVELSIHVPSCIHLAPSVSWGLGHFFSGDLHHPVESPYSQITFAVSGSPGSKLALLYMMRGDLWQHLNQAQLN